MSVNTFISKTRRRELVKDKSVGVGNFLEKAIDASPAPEVPLVELDRNYRDIEGDVYERFSLNDLEDISRTLAARYHALGVSAFDPVGLYLDEGTEFLLHSLALASLGAIPVQVNGRMKPATAGMFLAKVGAVGLFTQSHRLEKILASAESYEFKFVQTQATLAKVRPVDPPPAFIHDDQDIVMIGHSSGTTGIPKAVSFAHQQFFFGTRYRLASKAHFAPERILSALPHFHSAGIAFPMYALLTGTPLMILSDNSASGVLPAIEKFKPTTVVAFPQTHVAVAEQNLETYNLNSVERWVNTGDAAHAKHIRKLIQHGNRRIDNSLRPGSVFVDGLGSSEIAFSIFRMEHVAETPSPTRCVGKPAMGVTAAVLSESGDELPPGKVGRLGIKSPSITPGYWNDSNLTAKSKLRGSWLTGDLVYRDAELNFFHVDRVPDCIQTKDGRLPTLPLEEIIQGILPEIEDVTVIAARGAGKFETPVAILHTHSAMTPSEIQSAHERMNLVLASHGQALITKVFSERPDAIPVGPTGKVLKRELRQKYAAPLVERKVA